MLTYCRTLMRHINALKDTAPCTTSSISAVAVFAEHSACFSHFQPNFFKISAQAYLPSKAVSSVNADIRHGSLLKDDRGNKLGLATKPCSVSAT